MQKSLSVLVALAGLSTVLLPLTSLGEPRLPKTHGGDFVLNGTENMIIHKGPIGEPASHQQLVVGLTLAKPNPILYLDTGGGSIVAGMEIVKIIQDRGDVTCVTPMAASMGFAILQACKTRVVSGALPMLMQHPAQVVLQGQQSLTTLQATITDFLIPMSKAMTKFQAKRLKLTEAEFDAKIKHEWFLVGPEKILANNAADLHVNVRCGGAANTKTRVIKVQEQGTLISTVTVDKKVRWCPVFDIPAE